MRATPRIVRRLWRMCFALFFAAAFFFSKRCRRCSICRPLRRWLVLLTVVLVRVRLTNWLQPVGQARAT
jgi:hypothetical protein